MRDRKKPIWPTRVVEVMTFLALAMALIGPIGAGKGWWHFTVGLQSLFFASIVAVIALLMGLLLLWHYRRNKPDIVPGLVIAIVLLVGYLGFVGWTVANASQYPAIHDVTTDTANPPDFQRLVLRADNLRGVPGSDDRAMAGMNAQRRWQLLHERAYGDIKPLLVAGSCADTIKQAGSIARANGWEVVLDDAAAGRIEAVATSRLFKFRDDVVVVGTATDGGQCRIDMRSVSEVGLSDLGVNAARVRKFLGQLASDKP